MGYNCKFGKFMTISKPERKGSSILPEMVNYNFKPTLPRLLLFFLKIQVKYVLKKFQMMRNVYQIFLSLTWVPAFPRHLVVVLQFPPPTSLFPFSSFIYVIFVILNKVGKKERVNHTMKVHWYRTGVLVLTLLTCERISYLGQISMPTDYSSPV